MTHWRRDARCVVGATGFVPHAARLQLAHDVFEATPCEAMQRRAVVHLAHAERGFRIVVRGAARHAVAPVPFAAQTGDEGAGLDHRGRAPNVCDLFPDTSCRTPPALIFLS